MAKGEAALVAASRATEGVDLVSRSGKGKGL
jgi:hypothetical protein